MHKSPNFRTILKQPEFADVIEGNDTTIIENDTNIGNTNNTLPDSTDVNIREDCMQVPGQSEPYCP